MNELRMNFGSKTSKMWDDATNSVRKIHSRLKYYSSVVSVFRKLFTISLIARTVSVASILERNIQTGVLQEGFQVIITTAIRNVNNMRPRISPCLTPMIQSRD